MKFIIANECQILEIYLGIFYTFQRYRKPKTKKLLIFASVILTQVAAYTDIGIIVIFSAIIVDQYTGIKLLNDLIELFVNNIYLLY